MHNLIHDMQIFLPLISETIFKKQDGSTTKNKSKNVNACP
jgi:hypothetical protein